MSFVLSCVSGGCDSIVSFGSDGSSSLGINISLCTQDDDEEPSITTREDIVEREEIVLSSGQFEVVENCEVQVDVHTECTEEINVLTHHEHNEHFEVTIEQDDIVQCSPLSIDVETADISLDVDQTTLETTNITLDVNNNITVQTSDITIDTAIEAEFEVNVESHIHLETDVNIVEEHHNHLTIQHGGSVQSSDDEDDEEGDI